MNYIAQIGCLQLQLLDWLRAQQKEKKFFQVIEIMELQGDVLLQVYKQLQYIRRNPKSLQLAQL